MELLRDQAEGGTGSSAWFGLGALQLCVSNWREKGCPVRGTEGTRGRRCSGPDRVQDEASWGVRALRW